MLYTAFWQWLLYLVWVGVTKENNLQILLLLYTHLKNQNK